MYSCPFSLLSTESSKTCRTLAKGANVIRHGDHVPKSQGQRDVPVQVFKRIQRPCLINCRCDGAFGHHSPSGRSRVAESEQAEASSGENFAVGEDTDKNDSQDVP